MSYTPPPGSGADAAWLVNLGYVSPLGGEADASWGASGSITRYAKIEVPSPLSDPTVRFTIPYPVHALASSPLGEPTAVAVYTLPYPVYISVPTLLGDPSVLIVADVVLYAKKLRQVNNTRNVSAPPTLTKPKARGYTLQTEATSVVDGVTVSGKSYVRTQTVAVVNTVVGVFDLTFPAQAELEAIASDFGRYRIITSSSLLGVAAPTGCPPVRFRCMVGQSLNPAVLWSMEQEYDLYSESAQLYQWSLDQDYGLRYPASDWCLDQEYGLYAVQSYEWPLDQDYSIGLEVFEIEFTWATSGSAILYDFHALLNNLRTSVDPDANPIGIYQGAGVDIAQLQSRNVVDYQWYGHTIPSAPEGERTAEERLLKVSETVSAGVENLAANMNGLGTVPSALFWFSSWEDSPSHYSNMIYDGYLGSPNLKFMLSVDYTNSQPIYIPGSDTWLTPLTPGMLPGIFYVATLVIVDLGSGRDLMSKEFVLNSSYSVDIPIYEFLGMSWSTDAYAHTSASMAFTYSLIVTAAHESICSVMVSAQHEMPIHYGLAKAHSALYGDRILFSKDFLGEYDIEEFLRVTADHEIRWSSGIQANHTALYDSSVVVSVQQVFGYEPSVVLLYQQTFGYEPAVVIAHQQIFGYEPAIVVAHQQMFGYEPAVRLGSQQAFGYEPSAMLSVQREFGYEPSVLLVVQHRANYEDSGHVGAQHVMTYLSNVRVVASKIFGYGDTIPVLYQMETGYDIRNVNYVLTDFACFYTIYSGDALISMEDTIVTVRGVEIDFNKVEVSTDEGDLSWSMIVEIAEVAEFSAISKLDPVSVFLGGVEYVGFVDTKTINRSDVDTDISMSITAYSPAAMLDTPYAPVADYVLTERQSSREVVENILGQTVDWRIVDWAIPPYRFAAKESTPAAAARMIVEAAGGVLESNPDGTLYARYVFPVSVPEFASTAPDYTLSDIEDNISSKANFYRSDTYDMFRVQEGEGVNEDILEFTKNEDSNDSGILRAYPNPWRPSVLSVTHTNGPSVNLSFLGVRSREIEDETVEILEGVGRLKYPAVSVVRYEWLSTPMGDVFVEPRSKHLNVSDTSVNWGYGLIRVTYVVESMDYDVQFPVGNEVQFILLDMGV